MLTRAIPAAGPGAAPLRGVHHRPRATRRGPPSAQASRRERRGAEGFATVGKPAHCATIGVPEVRRSRSGCALIPPQSRGLDSYSQREASALQRPSARANRSRPRDRTRAIPATGPGAAPLRGVDHRPRAARHALRTAIDTSLTQRAQRRRGLRAGWPPAHCATIGVPEVRRSRSGRALIPPRSRCAGDYAHDAKPPRLRAPLREPSEAIPATGREQSARPDWEQRLSEALTTARAPRAAIGTRLTQRAQRRRGLRAGWQAAFLLLWASRRSAAPGPDARADFRVLRLVAT